MKAVRWHGRRDLRIDRVAEPTPAPDQVLIEVAWCGICGTDLHEYEAGPNIITTEPHPHTGVSAPVTIGHELSGVVVATGAAARHFAGGDRVTVDPCLACGECWHCRRGELVRCEVLAFIGMHHDGAMARFLLAPEHTVHRLPDSIDLEVGAMIEPLTVAMRAVQRSGLRAGDSATIVGAGPIGLMVLMMARAAGAAEVYVAERSPARKSMARRLGATAVFDPDEGDPVELIREATAGPGGTDIAFECVGIGATMRTAIAATRRGGTAAILGFSEEPTSFHFNDVLLAERTVVGSVGSVDDFPGTIALVADGRIDPSPLISDRIELEDAVEDGFRALLDDRDAHVKILVRPAAV